METSHAAEAVFAHDRTTKDLGMELLATGPGHARLRMTITDYMTNGHGTAHGGYLFLFADTSFACACNSYGPATVAAGAEIDFVMPAKVGDVLEAEAVERVAYGRNGIYDVTVSRGEEIIAEFRGRSRTLKGNGNGC